MAVFRRIANLFRSSKVAREINAELQAHIALRSDDNMARGMSPEEARRDALIRFGNPVVMKERSVGADTWLGVASLARDIRHSFRQLRRAPGFAITAMVTLALGIGANVIVFGVLNAIVLRPIDVPVANRLVEVVQKQKGDENQSYPDYLDYRARNSAFDDMAAYRTVVAGVNSGGTAQRTWAYEVTGNYFDMLGVQPQLGRFFHTSDEHGPNSAPYIVLSDTLWRTRFNADPHVIGTPVNINKHPFTVIGIAPRNFNGTEIFLWPEFWMPMVNEEQIEGYSYLDKRMNHGIWVIGVLKAGVTLQQATENLNAVARQMMHENPTWDDGIGARLVKPGLMGDILGGPTRPFLSVIMALALLVLIAAGMNLAGVFAARAADRSRELAIRLAIGSTRWRILRQILVEAVLVSLAGGAFGTLIASGMLGMLSRWQPISEYPIRVTVAADSRVYLIAVLLSLAGGILPGLLPARQIWRTAAMQATKSGAQESSILRRLTLRDLLLGVQIMLCALLVTASIVALRGMERTLRAPLGFVPQGVMMGHTDMHMGGYSDDAAFPVQRRMIEEVIHIRGVWAVGTVDSPPLSGGGSNSTVYREGTADFKPSNGALSAHYFSISPGYLAAAGTRLLAGRDFTWDDGAKAPKVALINENFAHRMYGNDPAVGRHFLGGDKTVYQVVGVVEDGKYDSLTEDPGAAMFFPLPQVHEGDTNLIVRSQLPPAEIASAMNRVLTGIDSSLPFTLRTWKDGLTLVLFPASVATGALGIMGLLAAMLAITGTFGMAAYTVSRRLRELGIRTALGAQRAQLMRAALGRPVAVLAVGSFAGLLLGVLVSKVLAYLVYEATPRDPLVLLGAVAAMSLIGIIATWIPARRALSVDPAQLLHEE